MTNFFGQADKFAIYKQILADGGYNYYIKIHVTGLILIVRETTAGNDFAYADGGYNVATAEVDYPTLEYKNSLAQL